MTPEQQREVCLHRLDRSRDALKEAQLLFSDEFLQGTNNRIYYALFYAVGALAIAHEFITSKHTGLQSWYNKKVLHKGLIGKELGQL